MKFLELWKIPAFNFSKICHILLAAKTWHFDLMFEKADILHIIQRYRMHKVFFSNDDFHWGVTDRLIVVLMPLSSLFALSWQPVIVSRGSRGTFAWKLNLLNRVTKFYLRLNENTARIWKYFSDILYCVICTCMQHYRWSVNKNLRMSLQKQFLLYTG